MTRLRISSRAKSDLDQIYDVISRDKPAAARQWVKRAYAEFARPVKNPQIGQARCNLRQNLRCISHGSYVIFFQPNQGALEIVRVIHGSRDIDALTW
jgi:toxin ParE1/3/4